MAEEAKEPKAPYVPFGTFLNFIDAQAEVGLPSTIDKSLMLKMSGGMQSMLLSALKSNGFIEAGGHPTERFENYVKRSVAERKILIGEGLRDAFPYLFVADVDLKRMTPGQFNKRIKDATGVSLSTLDKVASFFLGAAKHIDLPMSSHLEGRKPTFKFVKRPKAESGDFQEKVSEEQAEAQALSQQPNQGISDKALEYKLIDLMKDDGVGQEQMAAIWTLVQYLTARGKTYPTQSKPISKNETDND